jgi:hypothetical protein
MLFTTAAAVVSNSRIVGLILVLDSNNQVSKTTLQFGFFHIPASPANSNVNSS